MGRRVRTTVPQTEEQLTPKWHYLPDFKQRNKWFKKRQKRGYDQRHRVTAQPEINGGTEVWITSGGNPVRGRVTEAAGVPRSYLVETPSGVVQRNRHHLNIVPPQSERDPLTALLSQATTTLNNPSPIAGSPGHRLEQPLGPLTV